MLNPYQKKSFKFKTFEKKESELPRVDIVKIYEHLTGNTTKISGNQTIALCPIHGEDHPSFAMYHGEDGKNDNYYCFSCGANGDVFNLIEKITNCSFTEALEVAKRYGL